MSLQLAECFKYYATAQLPGQFTSTVLGSIVSGELVIGGGATAVNSFTLVGSAQGTIIVNMRVRLSLTGDTNFMLIRLMDGATAQCGLCIRKVDGKLFFFRNTDATQIGADSTHALTAGIDYDIEAKFVLGNTGTVECRVNGVVEIGPTTVDNTNTGNNTCTVVQICATAPFGSGLTGTNRLVHVIIMDGSGSDFNTFLGVVNVNLHTMSAAGTHSALARGGTDLGANYLQVNETTPDDDTTYVGSGTVNDMDTYAFTDMPAGVTVVYAVGVVFRAKRDDAATRGIKPVVRVNSADYLGAEKTMSSSYNFFGHWWTLNPDTAAAWTVSIANASEAGMKVTT